MSIQYILKSMMPNICYSQEDIEKLSKIRIIQKNLVHFQGFPDNISNPEILSKKEYFGQFGTIIKIMISSKEDKITKKKNNSAYITYSSNKEAALAILSVDSTYIENNFVRAFFGTSKYCIHFLNNSECINKENCMFIHSLQNEKDYLGVNSKFRYSDHIKLAKKIVKGTNINKVNFNVNNNNFCINNNNNNDCIIDNIIQLKRKNSNSTKSNSFCSNSLNSSFDSGINLKKNKNFNSLFQSKVQSRFFNNINSESKNDEICDDLKNLIDQISLRFSFFKPFDLYLNFNDCQIDLCKKIFKKTNNKDIENVYNNVLKN